MGWRLAEEAQDYAPDTLTPREMYVLCVLANAARDQTRLCPEGIEKRPELVRRMRCGRTERFAVLKSLVDKGALVVVRHGRDRGRSAVYAIAEFLSPGNPDSVSPGNPDSVGQVSPGNPDSVSPGFPTSQSGFPGLAPISPVSYPSSLSKALAIVTSKTPGAAPAERETVLDFIRATRRPDNEIPYLRAIRNEDWPDLLADSRRWPGGAANGSAVTRPEWCGKCDEHSRIRDRDDGRVERCPDCHPAPAGSAVRP